jgi:hypothetical protein
VYALTMLLFIDVPQALRNRQEALLDWPWWLRDTVYAGFIVAIIVTHRAEPVPFIYFQF